MKTLLYSGTKAERKEVLKTCSNIINNILNKEPKQSLWSIFKTRFNVAKGNLEVINKNMTGSGLGLKLKRKPNKSLSQGKRRNLKNISTEEKKM